MESEEDMTVNGSTYLLAVSNAGKIRAPYTFLHGCGQVS